MAPARSLEPQVRVDVGHKLVTRGVRRLQKHSEVLVRDHHEGYISSQDCENNQRNINGDALMKGEMALGSVRNGGGLADRAVALWTLRTQAPSAE